VKSISISAFSPVLATIIFSYYIAEKKYDFLNLVECVSTEPGNGQRDRYFNPFFGNYYVTSDSFDDRMATSLISKTCIHLVTMKSVELRIKIEITIFILFKKSISMAHYSILPYKSAFLTI
jgi:hypothetical protein